MIGRDHGNITIISDARNSSFPFCGTVDFFRVSVAACYEQMSGGVRSKTALYVVEVTQLGIDALSSYPPTHTD